MSFDTFNLPPNVVQVLSKLQFTTPTPIQAQAIPPAMEGKDILGTAQTGTGKTAAFGLPLIAKLMADSECHALVMTPTRELAAQVLEQINLFLGFRSGIKSALLIGGDSMGKQLNQLKNNPRLIVGTPGRINDHLTRRSLSLKKTAFLVLDETDRMLDMGFGVQIDKIIQHIAPQRQTLLFSATLPDNILKISKKYLTNPVRIAVGSTFAAAPKIKQDVLTVSDAEKYPALVTLLEERQGSIIIFVKTKHGCDKMADKIAKLGHKVDAIHGNLRQNQRNRVIQAFRDSKFRILVATDVASRGLDIPHIEHVINYDLPQNPEDYIHRIGRTARAGAEGHAVCLITPHDRGMWREIQKLMDPEGFKNQQPAQHGKDNAKPRRGSGGGRSFSPRRGAGKTKHSRDDRPQGKSNRGFFQSRDSGDRPKFQDSDSRDGRGNKAKFRPKFRDNKDNDKRDQNTRREGKPPGGFKPRGKAYFGKSKPKSFGGQRRHKTFA